MPKFRFACHVITWGDFANNNIEAVFKQIADAGYDGVEGLTVNTAEELVDIAAMAHAFGLHVVMVHPRTTGQLIRYNAALGNKTCEVWPGLCQDFGWPNISRSEMFDRLAQFYTPIFTEADRYGIGIHQHIHWTYQIESMKDISLAVEKMPKLGILLDTGHLIAAGGDPIEVLNRYPDRVTHVHLKDFQRGSDWNIDSKTWNEKTWNENYFAPLGQGNCGFDVKQLLHKLEEVGYDGWISLELDYMGPLLTNKVHPGTLIKQNREYLRSIGY